jgi:hypothetical protein
MRAPFRQREAMRRERYRRPTESCSGLFGSDDRPVAYMELTGRNDQVGDWQLQQMGAWTGGALVIHAQS